MQLVDAIPIDSPFDGKGDWVQHKIRRSMEQVHQALASGDNILIYPSGQLKASDKESLGGKSLVYDLLKAYPDTEVVVVCIYGRLYSTFGRDFTGGVQNPSLKHQWEIINRSRLHFMKRVPVEIDIMAPQVLPQFATARELNAYLEGIVNAKADYGPVHRESLRTVAEKVRYKYARKSEDADKASIDPAIATQVVMLVAKHAGVSEDAVQLDHNLQHDLHLDSLREVELRSDVEHRYRIEIDPTVQFETVRDLVVAAQGDLAEATSADLPTPKSWSGRRKAPKMARGNNIAHAILTQFRRMGLDTVYTHDPRAKNGKGDIVTYRTLLRNAILLARWITHKFPEEKRIGFMLPAASGAATVLLALLLSGKVAVPLNWTNGADILDSSIETAGVKVILSSDLFLTQAAVPLSESAVQRIVCLESMRADLGLWKLWRATEHATESPRQILRRFGNTAIADDVAVILFTSGSESAPKGVPLTHKNLMTNVDGMLDAIGGYANDSLLVFLPPFHSFGMVLMLLSMLSGVKTVYSPDPKRHRELSKVIKRFAVTLAAGTPDFISGIIAAADREEPERLASIRAWFSGAQKAPAALYETIAKRGSTLLEGYGITETSPLITVNRPNQTPIGVGRPIKGTTVRIIDKAFSPDDPATLAELPHGIEGLILVAGPGVFYGYLGSTSSPFILIDEVPYYNTGDLGYTDAAGHLTISGRLKRFLKYAGEMVNLTKIEDLLASAYPATDDGPQVAISGVEREEGGRPHIVLYTTRHDISVDDANSVLRAAKMPTYCYVSDVRTLEAIPLLGSGKTNHRALPPIEVPVAA